MLPCLHAIRQSCLTARQHSPRTKSPSTPHANSAVAGQRLPSKRQPASIDARFTAVASADAGATTSSNLRRDRAGQDTPPACNSVQWCAAGVAFLAYVATYFLQVMEGFGRVWDRFRPWPLHSKRLIGCTHPMARGLRLKQPAIASRVQCAYCWRVPHLCHWSRLARTGRCQTKKAAPYPRGIAS
jgi:hypothetical protein